MSRDHLMGYVQPLPALGEKIEEEPLPSKAEIDHFYHKVDVENFEHGNHLPLDDAKCGLPVDCEFSEVLPLQYIMQTQSVDEVPAPGSNEWCGPEGCDFLSGREWPFALIHKSFESDTKRAEYNDYLQRIAKRMGVKEGQVMPAALCREIDRCYEELEAFEFKEEQFKCTLQEIGKDIAKKSPDVQVYSLPKVSYVSCA